MPLNLKFPFCFLFHLGEMQCDLIGLGMVGMDRSLVGNWHPPSECVWNKMFVWGSQEYRGKFPVPAYYTNMQNYTD